MVYDAGGKLAAEYAQVSPPATGKIEFVTNNYQGSTSVVTDRGGAVTSRHDYLPFGEEIGASVGSRTTGKLFNQYDSIRQKYAGMETDTATGMAHTLWRKQDNWSGRWTSPDPYGGSMTTANPQSFNRYTYCDNDPVNHFDLVGLALSDIGVYQTEDASEASPDWEAQKRRQSGKGANGSRSGTPITIGGGSGAGRSGDGTGGSQKGAAGEHGGPQDDSHHDSNSVEPNYRITSDQGGSGTKHEIRQIVAIGEAAIDIREEPYATPHEELLGYQIDRDGKRVLDEDGNPIGIYSRTWARQILITVKDGDGRNIPFTEQTRGYDDEGNMSEQTRPNEPMVVTTMQGPPYSSSGAAIFSTQYKATINPGIETTVGYRVTNDHSSMYVDHGSYGAPRTIKYVYFSMAVVMQAPETRPAGRLHF